MKHESQLKRDLIKLVNEHCLEIKRGDGTFNMVDYLMNCIELMKIDVK